MFCSLKYLTSQYTNHSFSRTYYTGLVGWGQADKTHRNSPLLLENRALRLMVFGEFNAHATLKKCKMVSVFT